MDYGKMFKPFNQAKSLNWQIAV